MGDDASRAMSAPSSRRNKARASGVLASSSPFATASTTPRSSFAVSLEMSSSTSRRHRDAQAVVQARKVEATCRAAAGRVLQRPAAQPVALALWTCPDCGGPVTNPRRVRCETCIGADPAQAPEIRGRRGAAIAARKRALSEWDKANPDTVYDPELFRREILPRLSAVKLSEIIAAAGCSKAYASDIRRGKWMPHVSTWVALSELVGVEMNLTALS